MTLRQRVLISVAIAVASAALSYVLLVQRGYLASDFEYSLRAARALLAGLNPYEAIMPEGPYPFEKPFYYTLPAGIVALPLARFDSYIAGALFFGMSAGLLAFALTKEKPWRLLMLLSAPFFVAAQVAQWSPLMIAAGLLPPLRFLLAAKPNLGLALLAYLPSRREFVRAVLAILVFVVLAMVLCPSWIVYWLIITLSSRGDYVAPLLIFPGFLLLLSALRIRKQEGRLLLVMSLIPQFLFFYDQLPLWLIPKSPRAAIMLTISSWVGYWHYRFAAQGMDMAGHVHTSPRYVVFFIFLPALAVLFTPELDAIWRSVWLRSKHWVSSRNNGDI